MMSIVATLFEQGTGAPAMVDSAFSGVALPLELEAVHEVALIVSCVFSGWFMWSLLLSFFDPAGAAQSKFPITKKTKTVDCEESSCTEEATDEVMADANTSDWQEVQRSPSALQGLALLEHYGVLGASPGVWSCGAQ